MSTMAASISGQKKTGVEVWCPIVSELATEMATWGRRPGPFLLQSNGAHYSRKLFWTRFTEAIEDIPELAGATLHGLRCTAAIRLREAGLSVPQISDIMGMSMQTITRYCRFAERKSGGKEALIKLEEHRASKAKRGRERKMNSDCKTTVKHPVFTEENEHSERPD